MSNKAKVRLVTAIILIVLIGAVSIIYFKPGFNFSAFRNKPAGNSISSTDRTGQMERLSYIGEIKVLAEGSFTIVAKAQQNKLPQDRNIRVIVNGSTSYQQLGSGQENGGAIKIAALVFGDLKVGDTVLVFSGQEVTEQEIIIASSVQKIAQP